MIYNEQTNLKKALTFLTSRFPQHAAKIPKIALSAVSWRPSLSIRTLLAALVIATALPLVVLAFASNLQLIKREQAVTREALMAQAVALAALVDNEIDTHMAVTVTLATSQLLSTQNLTDFQTRARSALAIIPGAWLTVTDPDGRVLMTTADKTPLSTSTLVLPVTAQAWATHSAQISDVVTDPVTGATATFIVCPVVINQVPIYTLYMAMSPARYQALLAAQSKPSATTAIVDRRYHFIARIPTRAIGVNMTASPGWRGAMQKKASGFTENKTLEGTQSLTAYAQSRDGWTVGLALPTSELNSPMWNTIGSMALLSSLLLGTSLLVGWFIAKQLSHAMVALAKSAHNVGLGQTVEAVPFPVTEANDISFVLSTSSKALASRQAAMLESEAQFRGTFENAAVGIAHVATDGCFLLVNQRLCDMTGHTVEELIASRFPDRVHPDERPACELAFAKISNGNFVAHEVEKRFMLKNGDLIWVAVTLSLRRKLDGTPKYLIVVIRDITERRAVQDHQKFLLGEIAHRSKNQLAVIQAIANQTTRASKTLPEFRQNFAQRLNAIAISTDLLIAENWSSVSLINLVDRMVQSFITRPGQYTCDGPAVTLSADATQAIGLALHELGTNCVKHGAWSKPSGIVSVMWEFESVLKHEPDAGNPTLTDQPTPSIGNGTSVNGGTQPLQVRLSWVERGGPAVSPPTHSGFGQVVIEQMVAQKIGGTVEISYDVEGLSWQLTIPEAHFFTAREQKGFQTFRNPLPSSQQPSRL